MDNLIRSHIEQIQLASKQNRLVVFVGAGVSANSGVPTWKILIDSFKKDLPENIKEENDYLKIAQLYRDLRGGKEYLDKVKEVLKYGKVSPNNIHKEILDLDPCHIVTTNYDDLLEQSALTYNHQYYVVRQDIDLPANKGEKMIIKMHGDFNLGNIVLTENDYFDYSRNFPLIKSYVVSLFATKLVLFVGFSFNDINLKYILRNVRNVLGDKMQQAYLLTDTKYDNIIEAYYQSKGLRLINNLTIKNNGLPIGKRLQSQIYDIIHLDKYGDDIVALIMAFIEEYSDQIAYLGKYLELVIPIEKRQYFMMISGTVTLPQAYSKHLKEMLKTRKQMRALYQLYGNRIYNLFAFLLNNQVNEVDNINIATKIHLREYEKTKINDVTEYFYELDLVKVSEFIKKKRQIPFSNTKEDLQLPFALYKIGHYYESYQLFQKLAPEFWEKRKYYLYFICLYNIKILLRLLIREKVSDSLFEIESLKVEYTELNLQKILSNLPLESCLKSILRGILDFSVVKDLLIEVYTLQEKLERQKEQAKNGGFSYNSDILKLLYDFRQSFDFCNENCLVYDIYSESKSVYIKIAEGILDSVMTPVGDEGGQTKLEALTEDILPLFIFQLEHEDLKKILIQHADTKIPVTKEFRDSLIRLVSNLARSMDLVNGVTHKILPQDVVAKYIKNIMVLCLYIDNPPILNRIYELITETWYEGRFMLKLDVLNYFLLIQKPTCDEAVLLIKKILFYGNIPSMGSISECVVELSNVMQEEGRILDDLESINKITCQKFVPYTASFINIVKPKLKKEIVLYVQTNASCLQDLVLSELWTRAFFLTPKLINKFADKIKHPQYPYYEEFVCYNLVSITKTKRPKLQKSLERLAKKNDCINFFMNPLQQKNYSYENVEWMRFCDEDSVWKNLLKIEQVKNLVKDYLKKEKANDIIKKKFFELV